jgi:hypothetical protein
MRNKKGGPERGPAFSVGYGTEAWLLVERAAPASNEHSQGAGHLGRLVKSFSMKGL